MIAEWNDAAAARAVARTDPEYIFIIREFVRAVEAGVMRRLAKGLPPMPSYRNSRRARMARERPGPAKRRSA